MEDGAVGRVLELRARGKEDARGGSLDLWVLGCHLMNLACYFAGKPMACSAAVLQDGHPVTKSDVKEGDEGIGPLAGNEVHARFEMESGIPVFFDSIHDAGNKQAGFGAQIIGTLGIIDLRVDTEPVAQILAGSPFKPAAEARAWTPISTAGIGKPEPVANIGKQVMGHLTGAQDLIAAMRDNRQPLCNAEEGRTTIEMICAVFESNRLNGQRVTLPLKTRVNPLGLL
jgi:predicted dehydrogenase